ncbi:hypothetical protein YC2023_104652 [Brassica napus]
MNMTGNFSLLITLLPSSLMMILSPLLSPSSISTTNGFTPCVSNNRLATCPIQQPFLANTTAAFSITNTLFGFLMLKDDGFCGDDVNHDKDDDGLSSFSGRKMLFPGMVFVHDDSYGLTAFCIIVV